MKKIRFLAFLMGMVLLLGLCACGVNSNATDSSDSSDLDLKENENGKYTVSGETVIVIGIPEDFKNCFVYSTEQGTFLYKPKTDETIKVGSETSTAGGLFLHDNELFVSLDGKYYLRDVGSEEKGMEVFGSDGVKYSVFHTGDYVVFLEGNVLYKQSLKDGTKTKLADNVTDFVANGGFVYSTSDRELYISMAGKATLIDSDIDGETKFISGDLSYVVYLKDGDLYVYKYKEGSKKIAENVSNRGLNVVSGESIYFMPNQEYSDVSEEDTEKTPEIWYYNGVQTQRIGVDTSHGRLANGKLFFAEKIKNEDGAIIGERLCVATGNEVVSKEFDFVFSDDYSISANGKTVYVSDGKSIYKVAVGETVGEPEAVKLASGVVGVSYVNAVGESVIYNGKSVDGTINCYVDDVSIGYKYAPVNSKESNRLFYYDSNKSMYVFEDGKSTLVYENKDKKAISFNIFEDGSLMVSVYDDELMTSGEKVIYYWNGTELKKVAENATGSGMLYSPSSLFFDALENGRYSVYVG